jgi:tagatose-6-phosphate ketose/aldose isomerase
MGNTPGSVREEFLPVVAIIFGQLLGFFKSISLGSHPDSPSASGAISRIVKGVTIY